MPMFLIEENELLAELNTSKSRKSLIANLQENHWKLLTKFISWFYGQDGQFQGNYSRKYITFC